MVDMAFVAKSGFANKVRQSIVRILLGGVALSLVTLFGSPFKNHRGAVALIYLMIVAVVSLTGDLVSSATIAIVATVCLRYFFAPPISSSRIDEPLDIAALVTFLATAAVVTRLISKMHRLNQELRRREAYLAEAQRLSHTGSFGWRVPSGEFHWSEETFRIFQYDAGTKPTTDLVLQRFHPEDAAAVKQTIERASQEGKDFDFEHRLLMPDSSVKYVHVVARAVGDESGGIEFVGAVTDTTESKRAEEALRRSESYLAEAQRLAHTGSWVWRVAGRDALYLSEEWYRIYGFDPEEGIPAWEARLARVHPEDRARWQGVLDRAAREKSDYHVEFRILLPDGTVKYIHTIGHPVSNGLGELIQFVGSSTDITERKRAEEALRQAQSELARVTRVTTMGELTASLAHEVNQPIAAAVTNANTCLRWLARDRPDVEEARAAAIRIVKDGTRAAEIISRVRLLFKKGTPQRESVEVNEVIREMIILLRSEATRHNILVGTELATDLPPVMGDRVQLQQVVMNLMLNGIEAMKDVDGTRELSIKSQRAANDQILVSVSDTGVGLPPRQAEQIFDAFFTTKPHGTGMGLRISRSIIESHGGRLWAANNSVRGASFYVTLPSKVEAPG
jgi:PAS domain S-box-containing protein